MVTKSQNVFPLQQLAHPVQAAKPHYFSDLVNRQKDSPTLERKAPHMTHFKIMNTFSVKCSTLKIITDDKCMGNLQL